MPSICSPFHAAGATAPRCMAWLAFCLSAAVRAACARPAPGLLGARAGRISITQTAEVGSASTVTLWVLGAIGLVLAGLCAAALLRASQYRCSEAAAAQDDIYTQLVHYSMIRNRPNSVSPGAEARWPAAGKAAPLLDTSQLTPRTAWQYKIDQVRSAPVRPTLYEQRQQRRHADPRELPQSPFSWARPVAQEGSVLADVLFPADHKHANNTGRGAYWCAGAPGCGSLTSVAPAEHSAWFSESLVANAPLLGASREPEAASSHQLLHPMADVTVASIQRSMHPRQPDRLRRVCPVPQECSEEHVRACAQVREHALADPARPPPIRAPDCTPRAHAGAGKADC